jgi:choline dehydrogenase-like flavoprotein
VSKKIIIIGAGPAGMEAARVAALRGHAVVLIERDARRPGQSCDEDVNRGSFEEIIGWYERQLPKPGVEVRLKTEADAKMVLEENADEGIVATGSTAFLPMSKESKGRMSSSIGASPIRPPRYSRIAAVWLTIMSPSRRNGGANGMCDVPSPRIRSSMAGTPRPSLSKPRATSI